MAKDGHNMEASVKFKIETDEISNAGRGFEEANKQVKEFTRSIKEAETAMKNFNKASDSDGLTKGSNSELMKIRQMYQAGLKSHEEYVKEIKSREESLRKEIASMDSNDKGFKNKLNQYRAYQSEVERIEKSITTTANREAKAQSSYLNKQISSNINEYKKLNQQIQQMANTTSATKSIGSNILNGMITWGAVSQVSNALRQVTSSLVDINYNTVNNLRLMGDLGSAADETATKLNNAAVNMAKTTGIQITDAQQIQGAWIRINDTYADNADLLNEISQMTAEFMNVGEIEDAEQAVALLNASLLQFGVTTKDAAAKSQEFLDKWAYMADKTAMGTADEYGEAISKYGAQLRAVGGDMDDAIAQSSILADRLAMNGSEIGNALKTFNTYLTRDKTVKLFNDIAKATGDTSFKLADANGQLKEYRDILNTVSRAYQMYSQQGNDLMANKVLDAVGATRRRDVAMAMLSSASDGGYQEYLDMVQSPDANGYIEAQNAKLMETLKNQWNALVASMTSAGMALANSGILDGLTSIIGVAGQAFDAFSKLPTPVLEFISTLAMLKLGLTGMSKIGEITGFTKELTANIKQGSQAQREMAASVSNTAQSFMTQQQAVISSNNGLYNTTVAYRDAQLATETYTGGLKNLAQQYTNGEINAKQYTQGVQELTGVYQNQISAINETAQANLQAAQTELDNANVARKSATTVEEKAEATLRCQQAEKNLANATKEANAATDINCETTKNLTNAEKENANIKKQSANASKQKANSTKQEVSANKQVSTSSKQVTNAEKQEATAKKQSATASVGAATGNKTLSASNTAVSITSRIAAAGTSLFAGAIATLQAVLGVLLNPVNLVIMAISFFATALGDSASESEKLQESLDDMQGELDDTKERIQELNDLRESRGLTAGETAELEYLKQKNEQLERSIKLTKQAQNNSLYTEHQGGFLGFGGTNSGHEDVTELIDDYQRLSSSVKTYTDLSRDASLAEVDRARYTQMLSQYNEEYEQSAASVISKYYELNDAINNGEYSGKALTQAKYDLKELESLLPSAQLLVDAVDGTGYSFQSAAEQAEAYAQAVEDAANTASASSSKYNALENAIGNYEQNGYLSNDQVQQLVNSGSEFASLVEYVNGQWVLTNGYQEKAAELQNQVTEDTREMVEATREANIQSDNLAQTMSDLASAVFETKGMAEDIANAYGNTEGVSEFADSIEKIRQNFVEGTYTIDGYNTAMKELTEDTDFSMILTGQEEVNKMSDEQLQKLYAQQQMWQTLYADAGNTLTSLTEQYNAGKISIEDYSVGLAGVNDRFLQLAISSGIIKQTESGFVDVNGKTVEWANSLYNVSQSIGTMGSLFADNSNLITQAIQGNQAACDQLSSKFNDTMAVLKSTNETAWNEITAAMASAAGMSAEDFRSKYTTASGEVSSEFSSNAEVIKKALEEMQNQLGKGVSDACDKSSKAMGTLASDVSGKMSQASNSAKKDISSIQTAIDNLKGKTVTVNVNYVENGKPTSVNGTTGSMNISYYRSGNGRKYVEVNGNAFAEGKMGATQGGNTLVGELGTEIVVRNNRWFTVGDNGAEFVPIRKGDIVFNHKQSLELLKNRRVTSGSGRGLPVGFSANVNGNALAGGNALATGTKYTSSYKITDDLDVAMTKAVQKFSQEAERLIKQAEAAGENISDSLREAAQNAEKAAKEVESYTSKYISNIENMQKRSANALKEHYQLEYDERKKLLQKEHNEKLDAIDEEIARLRGDTTEDKEKQLADLQEQLAKWQGDNSSLGKKKQKELQDQIDALDKEIQIDKLQQQRDAENERYDNLIDSESEGYDSVLADLDNKMTDENLYKTVNELIKNGDTETLSALLAEHDAQWDGWKTLQGMTAAEVIQGEVKDAINNYKDVVGGYIDENGGIYTNGGTPNAPSTGGSTTSSTASKAVGIGTQINAGSAPIYAYAGSTSGMGQYFASDPIYNVIGENGNYVLVRWHKLSSGATGWFKKSDVTALKTGGYTGNYEGMAYLHAKERVLNAAQTAAFEKLVYNLLPSIPKALLNEGINNSNTTNNNGNVFNKELVKLEVGQIVNNTPFDIKNSEDNIDRMVRVSLKKSGVNFKV